MRSTPLPETIGRFKVEALLGRGGMGEVYKAFDPTLQRTVAVKTVRPDIDRAEYLERLMREAQACARLSHPNIVTVYEAGQIDGVVYIAMEYLQGENLSQVLERKDLSFEDKIRILIQVLEALHHAHGLDVVHRDIKPSNIHLQSRRSSSDSPRAEADGSVKLVDFGLARMLQADTLTASGNVLGTPHYASPEQLKGEQIDRRTDIYSTGVMAYEMLSGRRPFEPDNDSISSVILKVIQEVPAPMDTDMSRMLPEIEGIVSRAMAKSPTERFQTADEMRSALINFLDQSRARISAIESRGAASTIVVPAGEPVRTLVDAQARPSRRLWWAGGAAAAAIAIALMVGMPASGTESASVPPAGDPSPAATVATIVPAATAPEPPPPAATPSMGSPAMKSADAVVTVPVREVTARQLFASMTGTPSAGLRYRLIQQSPDGAEVDVDTATTFRSGDKLKLAFESNIDGYLYVASQGSSGNWTVLFPSPQINGGRNAIKRAEEYSVPPDGWFMFDANTGTEHLFVFLSREPLNQLPGFGRPVTKAETLTASVVQDLQQSIRSRDLVFEKDKSSAGKPGIQQATYVVNRAEVGKAVTATITLTHQ
ncbi:MAG: serine/threonine-protein kinase [Vicinamibacterales bacterium]|jgi:serine/threonine-protein kinase